MSQEHVLEAATRLLRELSETLAHAAVGARVLRLLLFRVVSQTRLLHDGDVVPLDLGLAAPSRDPEHIARLIGLRLDRLGEGSRRRLRFRGRQPSTCWPPSPCRSDRCGSAWKEDGPSADGLARLVDRLQQRLGRRRRPPAPPLPEPHSGARCSRPCRRGRVAGTGRSTPRRQARPMLLLPRPAGHGGRSHPRGGAAAAVPLARGSPPCGLVARPRAHRAGMVAPDS